MIQDTCKSNPLTEYVVRVSAAKMPGSCWGRYVRVAVLEVLPGTKPAMISARASGVVSIVQTWERCHSGRGIRDAASRAKTAARQLADELNGARCAS
jgi:hypothetical protein